eukprot:s2036_g5.t10
MQHAEGFAYASVFHLFTRSPEIALLALSRKGDKDFPWADRLRLGAAVASAVSHLRSCSLGSPHLNLKLSSMHGSLGCWVCLLVLSFPVDAGPATLRLHLLKGTRARCNDGSAPGFYLQEGRSGVLLVWLEGGGDCGTQATCDARPAALKGMDRRHGLVRTAMGIGDELKTPVPPRFMVLMADWCNVFAGITLVISFSLIAGAFTFKWFKMEGTAHTVMQVTMCLEGVLWAVAAGFLTKINMIVNNAGLAVGQTIICFGGIFFAISGLYDGVPGKIISLHYVLAPDSNALFADACPYYGITCFMVATSMGLQGVWPLPKNKIVSPFWAVACFFIGAWTIGVIGLWGPTLMDGFVRYEDFEAPTDLYKQRTFAWAWIHIFQVIGAIFWTAGGIIFGLMDGIFPFGGAGAEVLCEGSAHWPQLRQLDGIFSDAEDTNPFFATATRVFVPYCSSDSWVGNREAPAAGYFFQGERIISAVLEELRNRSVFEGIDLLVFGGCSAGGRGALYNLDRVCSWLPAALRCRGFLDAAWWEGLQLWGPSESLAPCLASAGEHAAHLCLFGPHFAPYVRTPFLVHEEQFDYFMLSKRGVQRPVFLWSPEAWQLARDLQEQVKSTLPILSGRRDAAAYSTSCTQHCFAESELFWRVRVQRGHFQSWSLEQLARSWLQEASPGSEGAVQRLRSGERGPDLVGGVLIDDCFDPNCSAGCPFEPSLRDLLLFACLLLALLACCILLLLRRRWLLGRCRRRFRPERSPTPQMLGASFGEADGLRKKLPSFGLPLSASVASTAPAAPLTKMSATPKARGDDPLAVQSSQIVLSVSSWCICSVGMMVFNKMAVTRFPAECCLVALQMAFCSAFLLCFAQKSIHIGSFRDVARWSLVIPCFSGMLLTSMLALKNAPMSLLVVLRCLSPGDYQKYMSQYAGDYEKYMHGGGGNGGSGDYEKYYKKYMSQYGSGASGGYEKFMSQYAGDYASKYMPSAESKSAEAKPVSLAAADESHSKKDSASKSDEAEQGGYQQYMNQAGDYKQYLQSYGGDYSKYMQGQGSQARSSQMEVESREYTLCITVDLQRWQVA